MRSIDLMLFMLAGIIIYGLYMKELFKKRTFYMLLIFSLLFVVARFMTYEIVWYDSFIICTLLGSYLVAIIFLFKGVLFKKSLNCILVLFGISIFLAYLFPIKDMPEPSKNVLIGTSVMVIEDSERIELYSDSLENRKFKVQFWYPASDVEDQTKALWLYEGAQVAKGLSLDNNLPSFALNHLATIESNSYIEAPISVSENEYPVVIISHGWRGFRNLHTDIAEELASNGYFVIAIDHTYGSVATVFSDNDVRYNLPSALSGEYGEEEYITSSFNLVTTYGNDVISLVDRLEEIDAVYDNMLDINNIGVLGHSTGGGGDVYAAVNDIRIKALFGLDSWVAPIGDIIEDKSLNIPAVFLRSAQWEEGENNTHLNNLIAQNTAYSRLYQIDGTTHIDFTMTYMFTSVTRLIGLTGELNSEYLNQMLDSSIVQFFDFTLKDNYHEPEMDWKEVKEILSNN